METDEPYCTLPTTSATKLNSVSRDANGVCVWSIVLNTNGPVIDVNNATLNAPYSDIYYRFRWTLTESAVISFYSEIKGNAVLPVIATDGRLAIFDDKSLTGEYIAYNYQQFIIASSKTVGITMVVDVVIPEVPYSYIVPSTKYLEFVYEYKSYKFPVYYIRQGPELVDTIVDKSMLELEALVKSSIIALALYIPRSLSTSSTEIASFSIIPTRTTLLTTPFSFPSEDYKFYTGDYVTIYEGGIPGQDVTCKLSAKSPNVYLSPIVFKGPQYSKRSVTYNIDILDGASQLNREYSVRLFKYSKASFIPQVDSSNKNISQSYVYRGATSITGTLPLEMNVTDAILTVRFAIGSQLQNAVDFTSVTYSAVQSN